MVYALMGLDDVRLHRRRVRVGGSLRPRESEEVRFPHRYCLRHTLDTDRDFRPALWPCDDCESGSVDEHTELSKVAKEIALILLGISVAGAVFLALLHWMVTL